MERLGLNYYRGDNKTLSDRFGQIESPDKMTPQKPISIIYRCGKLFTIMVNYICKNQWKLALEITN